MAKVKEDKSRVTLEVDGKQAINQLGKLEMEAKQLAIDLKLAKKGTQEYVDTNKKLKETESQIKAIRQQIGITGMTMTQLSRYQRELRKEIQNTTTSGTARYKELNAELQKVNKLLDQQRKELNGTKGFFSDIKKELKSFAVLAVGALGVTELFSGIQNLISGSAKLSDAYADVQKTTGLTKTEVEALSQELKKMDTRTSREELLKLAAEAGKLGITGTQNILDFVNGADKINVALGEDLGEDAIVSIGKLNELFGYREIYGYGDAMLKAGSAINQLGASSTASESYIVGFTARLGGAAKAAKISMMDIMGLAATLDSLGQQEETSSTAIGMFLVDMFKDTGTYAKIAGVELGAFTKLLNEDANEALLQVLEGLNGNNEGFATMVSKLSQVGVEGSRGTQVISALAGNTKLLREQQNIANDSFTKGTSILDEFNTKNQNFAGNLEKIQKWMAGLFVNGGVMEALNKFVAKWAEWISIPISQKMEDERLKMNNLYAQILTTNTGTEERIKLINELQRMSPQILGNLNAETVSNQELSLAVAKANEQLVNRIIIQAKQEEIEKNIQNQAEKKMDVLDQENKLRDMQTKLAEKYKITIEEANSPMEQFEKTLKKVNELEANQFGARGRLFNQTTEFSVQLKQYSDKVQFLNGMESFGNKLLQDKNDLIQKLGVNIDSLSNKSVTIPVTVNSNTPSLNVGGAAAGATDQDALAFATGVESIFQATLDKAQKNKDLTIKDTKLMYDNLTELGSKFGVDMKALGEKRAKDEADTLDKIRIAEQNTANARITVAMGLSQVLGSTIDIIGNKTGELTGFQKILAVAQIAIDSAVALAKAPKLSAEGASGSGPAAPLVFAANLATISGIIFSSIARAKNILSSSNVPEWNSGSGDNPNTGRSRPPKTEVKKSFYYGGDTGDQSIGMGDRYGTFTGFVHKNEYVIPSMTVSDPFVANLLPAIEQIRQDNIRGFSSTGSGINDGLEKKLDILIKVVSQWPKEVRSKIVYTEFQEIQEEEEMLRSRYRA
jgi:TP901 family phage tail tape measure protein